VDEFARQHEAARLLATAARQVAGCVKSVRAEYRRKGRSTATRVLGEQLLDLIQAALQLAAAAEQISGTILQKAKGEGKRKIAKGGRKSGRKARRTG
jgi:hypothetical protein